ncbi:MAG: hypothetical protein NTY07_13190 [Bacteroidia bacterium]|nr:hypothetical protein [Bacteroidia bacterium]
MKQFKIFVTLLILTFVGINVNATDLTDNSINLKGNSNTSLGNYEVKELPPYDVNGTMMRTFELTYEKAQISVLIYLDQRANCRDYVVRSKNLEVRYTCKKTSFGAQLLSGKQMKYDPALNALFISQDEFAKQQKISEGALPIASALGLIASYYPSLLKSPDLLN